MFALEKAVNEEKAKNKPGGGGGEIGSHVEEAPSNHVSTTAANLNNVGFSGVRFYINSTFITTVKQGVLGQKSITRIIGQMFWDKTSLKCTCSSSILSSVLTNKCFQNGAQ